MLLLAATPRFSTVGWFAPALVITGRLIQGFARPSNLLEAAPSHWRGLFANGNAATILAKSA